MESVKKNQQVIKSLMSDAKRKGYITIDDIFGAIDSVNLLIDDVDRICDILANRGIIIRDGEDTDSVGAQQNEIGYLSDRSKVDYDEIFLRVLDIDESLDIYINNLRHIAPPRVGEEHELIYKAREGNEYARNRLLDMHLKVVVRIALHYFEKYTFPLADTIQNGNIGLIIALNKMPLTPEYRYSSYAPWWIRQTIMRYNNSFCNKHYVPTYLKEKLYQTFDLINIHNCEECYKTSNYCCNNLIQEIAEKISGTKEIAIYYLYLLEEAMSLNEILEDNNDTLLSDNNVFMDILIEKLTYEECKIAIENILNKLKPKEKDIIKERFGLGENKSKTLEEIGSTMGITRERVRQIEKKAILRLTHPSCTKILREYY